MRVCQFHHLRKIQKEQYGCAMNLSKKFCRIFCEWFMVAQLGFEPRLDGPEPSVLPLHHRAINKYLLCHYPARNLTRGGTPPRVRQMAGHHRATLISYQQNFESRISTLSRPRSSIMSKSPAPTVLPLMATLVGCMSSAAFILSSSASLR